MGKSSYVEYCFFCDTEIESSDQFCPYCGAETENSKNIVPIKVKPTNSEVKTDYHDPASSYSSISQSDSKPVKRNRVQKSYQKPEPPPRAQRQVAQIQSYDKSQELRYRFKKKYGRYPSPEELGRFRKGLPIKKKSSKNNPCCVIIIILYVLFTIFGG